MDIDVGAISAVFRAAESKWEEAGMKPSDRRLALRFSLSVPVYIRTWKSPEPERKVESINLSESGVYFETNTPPSEGAIIHLRIEMPRAIIGSVGTEWRCIGKVVRVAQAGDLSRSGVAVQFAYYEAVTAAEFPAAMSATI